MADKLSFSNRSTIPSISNFAFSLPSETFSSKYNTSLDASILGKHEQETGRFRPPRKRRKVNGRPKNCWTPTRQRKLTRLYLMTELDVVDIIKILETEYFTPCQRDVQKQLSSLLQARPQKIRLKGSFTKRRLHQLRECRFPRNSRHLCKQRCKESDTQIGRYSSSKIEDEYQWEGLDTAHQWEELDTVQNESTQHMTFQDHSITCELQEVDYSGFALEEPLDLQAALVSSTLCGSFCRIAGDHRHCRPPESEASSRTAQIHFVTNKFSGSNFNLDLPEFGPVPALRKNPRVSSHSCLSVVDQHAAATQDIINVHDQARHLANSATPIEVNDAETKRQSFILTTRAAAKVNSEFLREELKNESTLALETSLHPIASADRDFLHDQPETPSISSAGGSSTQSRALNFKSLRRRLPLKYSSSLVRDVLYILEHLTLSGSSRLSSKRTERGSSRNSTRSQNDSFETEPSGWLSGADFIYPSTVPSSNLLCGATPGHCWEQIMPMVLNRSHILQKPDTQKNRPGGFKTSAALRASVLSSIVDSIGMVDDLTERDAFGNSVLHIIASVPNLRKFEYLVNLGADINLVNNAEQTFLHQAAEKCIERPNEIVFLLRIAKEQGFNFCKLDHLGQSVTHLLTRPWIPLHILDIFIATLHELGVDTTAARDYLGWTVVEQLNYLTSRDLDFNPLREVAVMGLTCERGGYITGQTKLPRYMDQTESQKYDDLLSCNFKVPTLIETLSDLENYTYHAELLRTINKAMSLPWFQDSSGRNGLHCLAEVSLKLPIHTSMKSSNDIIDPRPPRERYLIDLLLAGVDPNNYDKKGNTPLIAYIIHTRADDNDELMTRIMQKLLDAGANLHWRNRQGETALHIAIYLGRRIATRFLIQHNANLHARTSSDKGVLALGQEFCKRAKNNVILYAQIKLCMSLAIDAGAVSAPTVLQEWAQTKEVNKNRDRNYLKT